MIHAHVDVHPLRNTEWKTAKDRAVFGPNKGAHVPPQYAEITGDAFYLRGTTKASVNVDEKHALFLRHHMVKRKPRNCSYKP